MDRSDFPGDTVWADDSRLYRGVWDDLRFSAAGINPPGAASDPTRDTEDGCFLFSASATNILALQAQMPHDWAEGSSLHFHLHLSPTNTNTGNSLWRVEYKIAGKDEAFPANWTSIDMLVAGSGIADMHQLAEWDPPVSMTGKLVSTMIRIRISRIGGDATDTYNADMKLNEFDIHYLKDGIGSTSEYVK